MKRRMNLAILMIAAIVVGGLAFAGPAAASKTTTVYQEQNIYVTQSITGTAGQASNYAEINANQDANVGKHSSDAVQIQNIGVNQKIEEAKKHKDHGKHRDQQNQDPANVAIINANQNVN